MYQHIFDAYENKNRFAICLLELNVKEISCFESNCIHCEDLSKLNHQVTYGKVRYGWNIKVRRKECDNRIIPKVMKKNYFTITTNKEECLQLSLNINYCK